MSIDTRNEYERIDSLIDGGKAVAIPAYIPAKMPVLVEVHEVPRRKGRSPHFRVRVTAPEETQDLEIYVSPTGSSVKVFRNGVELR